MDNILGFSGPGSRGRPPVLAILLVAGALCSLAMAQTRSPSYDARVKASFLFNFARFVEWPGAAGEKMKVCATGDETLSAQLAQAFAGKTLQGRTVEVRPVHAAGEWQNCQLVYISHWASKQAPAILSATRGAPVLTVSDAPDFLDQGGLVQLTVDGSKIKYEVNREGAVRSRLRISSQLLRLAAAR